MDDLVNEVQKELGRSAWVKRLEIRVQWIRVNDSETFILLTGKSTSFYYKQIAQETALRVLRRQKSLVNLKNDIAVLYKVGKSA
jgi:hypothetical protein